MRRPPSGSRRRGRFGSRKGGEGRNANGETEAEAETTILEGTVDDLVSNGYEYVLAEGFHDAPYPKIQLGDREGTAPPIVARAECAEEIDVDALVDRSLEGRSEDS